MSTTVEKPSYFVGTNDDKYTLLKNPIGTNADTQNYISTEITSSTAIKRVQLAATAFYVSDGSTFTFKYAKSGNEYIDWDNSALKITVLHAKAAGTAIEATSHIGWNEIFNLFQSVILKIGNQVVFQKSGDDYLISQTMAAIIMNDKKEIESSETFFGPIGSKSYCTNIVAGVVSPLDYGQLSRNDNWGALMPITRMCELKYMLMSIPAFMMNLRTFELTMKNKLASDTPLGQHAAGTGFVYLVDMSLILKLYRPSANAQDAALADKERDDRLAFVEVVAGDRNYADKITLYNVDNPQVFGLVQFASMCTNATAHIFNVSADQTYLFNAAAAADTLASALTRSDTETTGASCLKSVQMTFKDGVYPYSSVSCAKGTNTKAIDHAQIYHEYVKTCKDFGVMCPAISEEHFMTVFPFICFKMYPQIKLSGAQDLTMQLNSTGTPTGQKCHLWAAVLRTYQINSAGNCTPV